MALMKGNYHGNGYGNRKTPYGLMIFTVFCAAIIGVLVLQKFRERRIFNLLVKEKDQELTTLQLLLQKERDHSREMKWKLEEVKTKVSTLRAQKRALDSSILEMQSTISSLKQEQRTIELALEEKENEIKLIRERSLDTSDSSPQVKALKEMLRQKESEVEDLKKRLENPVKVWSVSTDDPSSVNDNLQNGANDTKALEEKQNGARLQESSNHEKGKSSTELADSGSATVDIGNEQHGTQRKETRKNDGETVDGRGKIIEQTDKVDDIKESVLEHGNSNLTEREKEEGNSSDESQTKIASGIQEKKNATQIQSVENHDKQGQRIRDEIHGGQSTENKVVQTNDSLQGRASNFEVAKNQASAVKYNGGVKLEMPDQTQIGRNSLDGKGNLKKRKRKIRDKNRRTKENIGISERKGATAMREKSFIEGTIESERDKDGYQGTVHRNGDHYGSLSLGNDSGLEDHDSKISDKLIKHEFSQQEMTELVRVEHGEEQKDVSLKNEENRMQENKDSLQGIGLLNHAEDAEQLTTDRTSNTELKAKEVEILNDTNKNTDLDGIPQKDTSTNMVHHSEEEMFSKTKQHNQAESGTSENQAAGFQQPEERIVGAHKEDELSEQTETINSHEEPEFSEKTETAYGDEILSETKQQSQVEPETSENQATGIQHPEERRVGAHKEDDVSEQTETVDSHEEPEFSEKMETINRELETDVTRESILNTEADGRSYTDRTPETEF